MKDGLIVFLVGLMTITLTLTVITEVKEYKKSMIPEVEFVCKNGGLPDYRCFPNTKLRKNCRGRLKSYSQL